jgi:hypothetical protein
MVRIAITHAAFDAIAATLPLGSVGYEPQLDGQGNRLIWLDESTVNKLGALRGLADALGEHVIGGGQDFVSDGEGGAQRAAAGLQAVEFVF